MDLKYLVTMQDIAMMSSYKFPLSVSKMPRFKITDHVMTGKF